MKNKHINLPRGFCGGKEGILRIAIGVDHAALAYKKEIIAYLGEQGHEMIDFGCYTEESCDYPDFAHLVSAAVADGRADKGILICYSGIGMSMAANKHDGIRCSLCSEPLSARLTREHNDANVLAMGAGMIGLAMAKEIVSIWLNTEFAGGRHQRRVDKISQIEAR